MKGTFELKTPQDLLQKLRFDLDQLKKDATNTYLAFNFFVTAEHMKDWLFPGRANQMNRENLEKASPLLQVCSHVANGAKHFQVEAKHHRSVSDTVRTGGWGSGHWGSGHWGEGALVVQLQGDAEKHLGSSIKVVELADSILSFWESRPELRPELAKP